MPKALIIVDVQKDFCPLGALAVPKGDEVVPIINRLMQAFFKQNHTVVATQDWHPAGHGSFASANKTQPFTMGELSGQPQMMWPDHCVQDTDGAEMHPDLLDVPTVVLKGTDPTVDSYSGFFDNGGKNDTGLNGILKDAGVKEVFIVGLATDYCVKATALDAIKLGYTVYVIGDACRGVDFPAGSVDAAIAEMKAAGVVVITNSIVILSLFG
jgi:nicotinamidase/pyrazinamidase